MFGHAAAYFAAKNRMKTLPEVEVTEEEFLKAFTDIGKTENQAKTQLAVAKGLDGSVMVGDKMLKLKTEAPKQEWIK